jgi:hypothetical protein
VLGRARCCVVSVNLLGPDEFHNNSRPLWDCGKYPCSACGISRHTVRYGAVPYVIKEHVQIVEDVLLSPAERQQVFWKTSNRVFRLGLFDNDSSPFKSSVERLAAC